MSFFSLTGGGCFRQAIFNYFRSVAVGGVPQECKSFDRSHSLVQLIRDRESPFSFIVDYMLIEARYAWIEKLPLLFPPAETTPDRVMSRTVDDFKDCSLVEVRPGRCVPSTLLAYPPPLSLSLSLSLSLLA